MILPGLRDRAATTALLALALVPVLVISGPVELGPGLVPAYRLKLAVAVVLAAALLASIGIERVWRGEVVPRAANAPQWLARALLIWTGLSWISTAASSEVGPALLRILMLANFVALVGAARISNRTVVAVLAATALGLSTLALLEVAGVQLFGRGQLAPSASLGHRNNVAFHLAAGLPLVVVAALAAPRRWMRIAAMLGVALLVAGLVVARSRSGWLAGFIAVLPVWWLRPSLRRLLLPVVLGCVVAAIAAPRGGLERLGQRVTQAFDPATDAYVDRARLIEDTTAEIAQRPLLGWGIGSFHARHPTYFHGRIAADHPHNDALTAAYESGVPAAALLVLLIGWVLSGALRQAVTGDPLAVAAVGALLAWIVLGLTNSPIALAPSAVHFWLTLGLAGRCRQLENSRQLENRRQGEERT